MTSVQFTPTWPQTMKTCYKCACFEFYSGGLRKMKFNDVLRLDLLLSTLYEFQLHDLFL